MSESPKLKRLLQRGTFREASRLAQAIAQASGQGIKVSRAPVGFALWVASDAFDSVYAVAAGIVDEERAARYAAGLWAAGDEDDDGESMNDAQMQDYLLERRDELIAELSEYDAHQSASDEEGWFYADEADDD